MVTFKKYNLTMKCKMKDSYIFNRRIFRKVNIFSVMKTLIFKSQKVFFLILKSEVRMSIIGLHAFFQHKWDKRLFDIHFKGKGKIK